MARGYISNQKEAKLFKAIKAECGVDDADDEMLGTFVMVYACTEGVTFDFDGHERAPLTQFKKLWDALGKSPSPEKLWEMRTTIPTKLFSEWCRVFNAAQELFDVPEEQKPLDQLDPDKREEAQKPNSPLLEQTGYGKSA